MTDSLLAKFLESQRQVEGEVEVETQTRQEVREAVGKHL